MSYAYQIKIVADSLQEINAVLDNLKKAGIDNSGLIISDGQVDWTVITGGKKKGVDFKKIRQ